MGMFRMCSLLREVDLTGFDIGLTYTMACVFLGCSSLKTVSLAGHDASSLKVAYRLFYGCSSLEGIDLSGSFDSLLDGIREHPTSWDGIFEDRKSVV